MRITGVSLMCLLLAGCVAIPSEKAARMSAASQRYASVTVGIMKKDLIAALGAPQREIGRSALWEERYDAGNYDSLAIDFDAGERAVKVTNTHRRRSWGPFGSYTRENIYEYLPNQPLVPTPGNASQGSGDHSSGEAHL
jgi:uncharacterized protein YceK